MAGRLNREHHAAKRAATEASRVILKIYESDFKVEMKGVDDPVTRADREANDLIVASLSHEFPEDAFVGEESGDHADRAWVGAHRIWYIDPVDGTKEFVEKNGQFAIHIGLAIDGEAVLGVVLQPVTGIIYSGIVGEGAWLEKNGVISAVRVPLTSDVSKATVLHTRSHKSEALQAMLDALGPAKAFGHGSVGLKIGRILEHQADFYIETTSYSKAWDSCAPEAILRAAGGSFTTLRGDPLRYGVPELRNLNGLCATNGALHKAVVGSLQGLLAKFKLG
jgi:3'(2'), 5'-bisphosphate nucleotidase